MLRSIFKYQNCLFHKSTLNNQIFRLFCESKMVQFSDIEIQQQLEAKNKGITNARPWKADELRLKSNEDLHKLWYVMIKERNANLSDNQLYSKIQQRAPDKTRLISMKKTMARILTVLNERKKVREQFRQKLEDDYIKQQRTLYEEKLKEEEKKIEHQIKLPEITTKLLQAKMGYLRRGIDNTDYIQEALDIQNKKEQMQQYLKNKYDYQNKKIVKLEDQTNDNFIDEQNIIKQFSSSIQKSLKNGEPIKMSQQEILASHVKNWKMLTIKQKRVVLGFLNARRAKESKLLFKQEIELVRQKIQYDLKQQKQQSS